MSLKKTPVIYSKYHKQNKVITATEKKQNIEWPSITLPYKH